MVVIYCDASFNKETLKCGCGVVIKQLIPGGIKETRLQISDYAQDNNEAELKAVMHSLRHLDKPQRETINIVTDSQVAINEMKKVINKASLDISLVSPKYQETVKRILREIEGERIRVYHVKGHSSKQKEYSQFNQICDRLAKKSIGR